MRIKLTMKCVNWEPGTVLDTEETDPEKRVTEFHAEALIEQGAAVIVEDEDVAKSATDDAPNKMVKRRQMVTK